MYSIQRKANHLVSVDLRDCQWILPFLFLGELKGRQQYNAESQCKALEYNGLCHENRISQSEEPRATRKLLFNLPQFPEPTALARWWPEGHLIWLVICSLLLRQLLPSLEVCFKSTERIFAGRAGNLSKQLEQAPDDKLPKADLRLWDGYRTSVAIH